MRKERKISPNPPDLDFCSIAETHEGVAVAKDFRLFSLAKAIDARYAVRQILRMRLAASANSALA